MIKEKKQKRSEGDVIKISLDDGFHAYARALKTPSFAFYDCRTKDDIPIYEIIKHPILFQVAVMHYAITKNRWTIIGNVPLELSLQKIPPKFIQDIIDKNIFRIYENGKIRPSTRQECLGLDRASVWDPEHVESRLNDHYAGRKNKWVESQKIRTDA